MKAKNKQRGDYKMIPVFYRKIRLCTGQTFESVARTAHVLGYEMIPFDGWDNTDLMGCCKNMARLNLKRAIEIQDSCQMNYPDGNDWPQIISTRD
jgi:hypothetical protein